MTYRQAVAALPTGSIVVLTDGLIERRDRSLEDGLQMLRRLVAEGPRAPDALADYVLAHAFREHERSDDVAVLVGSPPDRSVGAAGADASVRAGRAAHGTGRASRLAGAGGVDGADAHDIVLATWEACANAVEHPEDPARAVFTLEASGTATASACSSAMAAGDRSSSARSVASAFG